MFLSRTPYRHFLTLFFACNFFAIQKANASDSTAVLSRGIADLRKANFKGRSVMLTGTSAFAWKQLLTPQDTARFHSYAPFPGVWNDMTVDGRKLSAEGYATYGFTLLLPHRHQPMALGMPQVYSSYKLFINGRLAAVNGNPATSKINYTPRWIPVVVHLPENTDTVQLIFQVANFSHYKGGVSVGIEVGESAFLFSQKEEIIASDFLLAGCLFMAGLFFWGLFAFGTRDKATFYFAFFCMLYSYRMVGSGFYSLHAVFSNLPWELTIRLEYLSLFGAVFFFFRFIWHLYPKDNYKPFVKFVSVFTAVLCLAVLLTPASVFTRLLTSFLLLMFAVIVYLIVVFVKAYVHKRIAAGYALTSVVVLMVMQLLLELEYFGVLLPSKLIFFSGHIIFFFLQSLILSFRFAYALQESKRKAELGLQAKSEFLSTMSHEIRTPLNSVIGMSNLMLRNNPRPDQEEQLGVLQFSAKNLLNIVNDILDYNKIEAGKINFEEIEMDLPAILNNIVSGSKSVAEEKGIAVYLKLDDKIDRFLLGDPTRLSQVVQNLLNNAVKFTAEGSVSIELSVLEKSQGTISILFSVTDTGIGIPKEKQQVIFDEFTQADSSTSRSFGGTGLGLAITKKILALQGSKLQVNSEPGKGSTFYFVQTFKLTNKLLSVKLPSSEASEEKSLTGTVILLVEDNPINILVAKTFLENWGAVIDVAENGQEALDILDVSRHKLVLMDLHMPVMDGYTAIKIIREKGIHIPIIALTASLPNEVENEIQHLEIDGFVLKPFVPEELYKKVQHFAAAATNLAN